MIARVFGPLMILASAGCMNAAAKTPADAAAPAAGKVTAELHDAKGAVVGHATASEVNGGLRVSVEAMGVAPGTHGLHVHTVGKCDAPDFTTAGGHWNPSGKMHGAQNPQGPHAGDMPNLTISADGKGKLAMTLPSGTLAGLLDTDGAAIVIHATADDMKTDPSGNSGARIACGVFTQG